MAIEQENKEPSMAEILSSIRQILEETNFSNNEKNINDDILDLTPAMMVNTNENYQIKGSIPVQPTDFVNGTVKKTSDEEEIIKYQTSLQDVNDINDKQKTDLTTDVSKEIINSFTHLFEQTDYRRRTEKPIYDADALLRQIVEKVISEKLDNHMLQNVIKENIVPVLEEWLSHYLPRLVAQEVERVIVKTGRR